MIDRRSIKEWDQLKKYNPGDMCYRVSTDIGHASDTYFIRLNGENYNQRYEPETESILTRNWATYIGEDYSGGEVIGSFGNSIYGFITFPSNIFKDLDINAMTNLDLRNRIKRLHSIIGGSYPLFSYFNDSTQGTKISPKHFEGAESYLGKINSLLTEPLKPGSFVTATTNPEVPFIVSTGSSLHYYVGEDIMKPLIPK